MKIFKSTFIALLVLPFFLFSCSDDESNNLNDYGQHDQSNYPAGYYKSAEGKTKEGLKTALYEIIKDHRRRSYSQLWTDFRSTDVKPNGRVWDIYSNTSNYIFGEDQQNYTSGVIGRYNREHSFPKSWFNTSGSKDKEESKSIYTDLFHLYPSNGVANETRSNYPYFGVTKKVEKVISSNGKKESFDQSYCKYGNAAGYPNMLFFEPNDEIKGDLARTYFYIATRYENGENNDLAYWPGSGGTGRIEILTKTAYPFFTNTMLSTLIKWHRQDPVSQKEINRNEAIYKIQGNRNPYIDCPVLVEYIWGDRMGKPFEGSK